MRYSGEVLVLSRRNLLALLKKGNGGSIARCIPGPDGKVVLVQVMVEDAPHEEFPVLPTHGLELSHNSFKD